MFSSLGSVQPLNCLRPLPGFPFRSHDLGRPSPRQVDRRADEEDDERWGSLVLDFEVELERISRKMSTNIEQYQVVELGSPQKPRPGEILGDVYLDAVTLQDTYAHIAGGLVGIDEENFLTIENR